MKVSQQKKSIIRLFLRATLSQNSSIFYHFSFWLCCCPVDPIYFSNLDCLLIYVKARGDKTSSSIFSVSFFSLLTRERELEREREKERERGRERERQRGRLTPFQLCQSGKMAFSFMLLPSLLSVSCCSQLKLFPKKEEKGEKRLSLHFSRSDPKEREKSERGNLLGVIWKQYEREREQV